MAMTAFAQPESHAMAKSKSAVEQQAKKRRRPGIREVMEKKKNEE